MRDWEVGDLIDSHWKIERVIGTGGMSAVFIVYDRETAAPLAVKTLLHRDILAHDATIASRFEQEVRIWFEMGAHENVVEPHFLKRAEGRPSFCRVRRGWRSRELDSSSSR